MKAQWRMNSEIMFFYFKNEEIGFLNNLASMHSKEWNCQTTPEMLSKRFCSGNYFKVVSDFASEEDVELIKKQSGLCFCVKSLLPVGLLETIAIKTNGYYDNVPKTIDKLTNFGDWSAPSEDCDTLILVDVTVLSSRRSVKGKGEAKSLIVSSLDDFKKMPCKFFWSYTPNIEKVKEWHKSLGAEDTKYAIKTARPNYNYPDVNFMNYTKLIDSLKI